MILYYIIIIIIIVVIIIIIKAKRKESLIQNVFELNVYRSHFQHNTQCKIK